MSAGENIYFIRTKSGDKFRAREPISDVLALRRSSHRENGGRQQMLRNMIAARESLIDQIGKETSRVFNGGALAINMNDVSSISYVGGFVTENEFESGENELFFVVSSIDTTRSRSIEGPYTNEQLVNAHPTLAFARDIPEEEGPVVPFPLPTRKEMVLTEDGEKFVIAAPSMLRQVAPRQERPIPAEFLPTAVFYDSADGRKLNVVIDSRQNIDALAIGDNERPLLTLCDEHGVPTGPVTTHIRATRVTAFGNRN